MSKDHPGRLVRLALRALMGVTVLTALWVLPGLWDQRVRQERQGRRDRRARARRGRKAHPDPWDRKVTWAALAHLEQAERAARQDRPAWRDRSDFLVLPEQQAEWDRRDRLARKVRLVPKDPQDPLERP